MLLYTESSTDADKEGAAPFEPTERQVPSSPGVTTSEGGMETEMEDAAPQEPVSTEPPTTPPADSEGGAEMEVEEANRPSNSGVVVNEGSRREEHDKIGDQDGDREKEEEVDAAESVGQ